MYTLDSNLLLKFNKPTPRYTSYPTAPEWGPLTPQLYAEKISALPSSSPLSLYFHIPFCHSMCLYCGCSVVLNRKAENEERYVHYLMKEIELVASLLGERRKVAQMHFGGGTPTKLSIPLFQKLYDKIASSFDLSDAVEIAIEIDPRTILEADGEKLKLFKSLQFNRISFGVQDTDPKVQEAVKRRQTWEMTETTFELARKLQFKGINIDLIYGLPYQTPETFEKTASHITGLKPDRIALFSYAKVPWLKPHQNAIPEHTLPSTEMKFTIYNNARKAFVQEGYLAIGMDHFALETDSMGWGYQNKKLQRNFQGYSLKLADHTISFGVTAIGFVNNTYIQNVKELPEYYRALDANLLPLHRGKELTSEDHIRKWVIHTLMCDFSLDKALFQDLFKCDFDSHFTDVLPKLKDLEKEGLLTHTNKSIHISPLGELFIRNVAVLFDAYQKPSIALPKFSQAI